MPLRSRSGSLIAPIAALAVVTSACSSELPGSPVPRAAAVKSSTQPADVFRNLKACDLLEPTTTTKDFDPPAEETYESDNGCGTRKYGFGSVTLYLVPEAGIDQLSPGQGTKIPTKVGEREAVEIPGDAGKQACTVAIAVTPNARMTASTGLNKGTNEEACALSREIATAAEPKLPRGS
ncbi:hypothetical protein [Amycolatopsis sp. WAC 04182]|uniref:hypothetical protein n=1 Tax=Amycolatopsis sp. WAC 04182 TaxID=2203198 RepID=UPI000F77BD2D|nr:hypothetical protein [Amycolatopsis sp. WAC 04182]